MRTGPAFAGFSHAQAVLDALDVELDGRGRLPGLDPGAPPGAWLGDVVQAVPDWRQALADGLVERLRLLPPDAAYVALRLLGGGLQSARLAGQLLEAVEHLGPVPQAEAFLLAARCLAQGEPPGALAKVQALWPRHPAVWVVWQALAPTDALPHLAAALNRADATQAQALAVAATQQREGILAVAGLAAALAAPLQEPVARVVRAALNGAFARDKALREQVDKLWPQRLR